LAGGPVSVSDCMGGVSGLSAAWYFGVLENPTSTWISYRRV